MVDNEKSNEELNKIFLLTFFIDKKVPDAAMPNNAMLTTINAKWYHCIIENNLIKEISNAKVAKEIRKIP